ncbi:hypothetical protein BRPE64_ECDS01280 (plasmid) [Caballeronia insecticola]|uniref:Uncharacterized protein n=1 Tax=Caballeronia insecticola TaxID=758793 RepID=A0A060PRC0_9BURK|nr:hypothetical protein BRPE64_ECDS01280 [Caballeronia insecticola]
MRAGKADINAVRRAGVRSHECADCRGSRPVPLDRAGYPGCKRVCAEPGRPLSRDAAGQPRSGLTAPIR